MKTKFLKKIRKITQILLVPIVMCSNNYAKASVTQVGNVQNYQQQNAANTKTDDQLKPSWKCHLVVTGTAIKASCLTCHDGSATASITGAVMPVTYKWSNGDTTSSIDSLRPGLYTCCVKDANGCHDCVTIKVGNADTNKCTLAITTSATNATCLTCGNGSATAAISGGLAPIEIKWSNGDTTASITNLSPGVYTCCVRDANGCHDCSTVKVENADTNKCTLAITTSAINAACLTCGNGSATATISGGLAPIEIKWSNGDTTASITNLSPGVYTCCVRDANGCHDCSTVKVENADTNKCTLAVVTSATSTSCLTCANGSVTATISGGLAPIKIRWSNGDTTATIDSLLPGVYTCCVHDANGCHDCSTVTVLNGDTNKCALVLQTSSVMASCFTCANGSATMAVSGGLTPIVYVWNNGDTTATINNLTPGIYICCVRDANGCHDCASVVVGDSGMVKCNLGLQLTSTQASCFTCKNGSATITVTGGTAPYSYKWSNGDTTSVADSLHPGLYTCCVRDANGCHDCSIVIVGDSGIHWLGHSTNPNQAGLQTTNMNGEELDLYPNPNKGTFRLAINGGNENDNAQLMVTNVLGEVVYQGTASINNGVMVQDLDLGSISSGTYFVRITTSSQVYNTKFVVNK